MACIWWVAVAATDASSDFLLSPWQVAQKLVWLAQSGNRIGEGTLWIHAGWSVLRFLSGFLLALAVGVPLGLLMGQSRLAGGLLTPLFNAFRNVPPIAWAPFSLLWFGASLGSAPTERWRAGAAPAEPAPTRMKSWVSFISRSSGNGQPPNRSPARSCRTVRHGQRSHRPRSHGTNHGRAVARSALAAALMRQVGEPAHCPAHSPAVKVVTARR